MTNGGLTVEAYSGARHAERPLAFLWRDRRYQVLSIERRWRSPGRLGFTVIASPAGSVESDLVERGIAADPCGAEQKASLRQRWRLIYDEVEHRWYGQCTTFDDEGAA